MIEFNVDVQRQIIALGLDDFCPNAMLPNVHGGQYGAAHADWRKRVVLLACAMLTAGLIRPFPGLQNYQNRNSAEIENLLQKGDSKNELGVDFVWDVMYFFGTEKLHRLLQDFDLNAWKAIDTGLCMLLAGLLQN